LRAPCPAQVPSQVPDSDQIGNAEQVGGKATEEPVEADGQLGGQGENEFGIGISAGSDELGRLSPAFENPDLFSVSSTRLGMAASRLTSAVDREREEEVSARLPADSSSTH
jgi:hypothetical protein